MGEQGLKITKSLRENHEKDSLGDLEKELIAASMSEDHSDFERFQPIGSYLIEDFSQSLRNYFWVSHIGRLLFVVAFSFNPILEQSLSITYVAISLAIYSVVWLFSTMGIRLRAIEVKEILVSVAAGENRKRWLDEYIFARYRLTDSKRGMLRNFWLIEPILWISVFFAIFVSLR